MANWEQLNNTAEPSKVVENHENDKLNHLVYRVFGTEDGKELLEMLVKNHLMAPVCPPNTTASYGYYREGQNEIIRGFMRCIKAHENIGKRSKKEGKA